MTEINRYIGDFDETKGKIKRGEKNSESNWISYSIEHDGVKYFCSAKAFKNSSGFGINDGRVSKLTVHEKRWNGKCLFNYDRGEDFDELPKGVLAKVLAPFGE